MFLNNNLIPEDGTSEFTNANLAWLAQIHVGLQHERFLRSVRTDKSIQEGFSFIILHARLAASVPYGYRLYSVFFFLFDSIERSGTYPCACLN